MPRARLASLLLVALVASFASAPLTAQVAAPAPAPAPPPATPGLDFSGVLFGSYSFQPSTTPNQQPNQNDNSFLLDRAYLTFKMPAGDRTSIRITTDVYPTTEATSNAYTIRAKYAYLQYAGARFANGASVTGRIGILQNVVIESIEAFWPRYLSQVSIEKAGYFASADVGLSSIVALPSKMGEVYATITNGPGYQFRERDRFKDYAIRLSLTPLANDPTRSPLMQNLTLSLWGYKGATASGFVNGGAAQTGNIGESIDRSRAGVFVGIRDPRLVIGGEYAQRHDGIEQGANTVLAPRTVGSTTGRIYSAFTVIRPFAFTNGTGKSPFGLVARYDQVKPTASSDNLTPVPVSDNAYHVVIGGLFYDLSQRAQLALDYQEALASNNGTSNAPTSGQTKGYFAHFNVSF